MRSSSRPIALGGMLAALACVIMGMGGLIPVATYVVPMLCMFLLQFVLKSYGSRIGWAWSGCHRFRPPSSSRSFAGTKRRFLSSSFAGYLPIIGSHLLHFAPLYYHFAPLTDSIHPPSEKINLFQLFFRKKLQNSAYS